MFDETSSHYEYIEKYGKQFSDAIGLDYPVSDLLSAHGDKAYGYRSEFEKAGIPFAKGVMVFLLSYIDPYSKTVRDTSTGWVDTLSWVLMLCEYDDKIKAALAPLPNYFTKKV